MPRVVRGRAPRRGRLLTRGFALALPITIIAAIGCGDAHWQTLRWPSERTDAPPQPQLAAGELGLELSATRIDYEPEAVVVTLTLHNAGTERLRIERESILLAWDELEYPLDARERGPAWFELDPGADAETTLRYHLGHPLTGSGARLVLRSVVRGERAIVELPELPLPASPG